MTIRWTPEQYAAWEQQRGVEPSRIELPTDAKASAAGRASAARERSTAAPDIEGALVVELTRAGLGGYQRNYRFDPRRRFELDFAWVRERVAIEVQGGLHSRGAHVRPEGYTRDAHKARRALLMGWQVFPATAACVRDGSIVADVETALELRRV